MPRMSTTDPHPPGGADDVEALVGHPRGTLAIVIIFAVLFAIGWFTMFLFRFMEQGPPHHY
jgi:hypothetical protein